ncbi:hypothetical protein ABZP36_019745 [Zizania latifolia]
MTNVRPPDLVPRRPPPPAPLSPVQAALPTPAAATDVVVGRPQLLPYACTRVVGGWHGCWKEGVAESWCPTTEDPTAEDASVTGLSVDSGGGGYHEDDDDDGCGSCVDGGEGTVAWRERSVDKGSSSVSSLPWWSQVDGSGGGGGSFLWPPPSASRATDHPDHRAGSERHDVDDDPKATAARRQEEDRKFWEECLASGYP